MSQLFIPAAPRAGSRMAALPKLSALKAAFRRHPRLISALGITTLITLIFAIRIVWGIVYWTIHVNEPVRPWMTVGYVGRSWGLNARQIDDAAGLPRPVDHHPLTLWEIAKQRGVPVEQVIGEVEQAVAKLKADQQKGDKP